MNTAGVERAKPTYKNSSNINNGKFAKCHTLRKALHIDSEQYDRMQTGKDDKIHQSDNERNSDKHKAVAKRATAQRAALDPKQTMGWLQTACNMFVLGNRKETEVFALTFFLADMQEIREALVQQWRHCFKAAHPPGIHAHTWRFKHHISHRHSDLKHDLPQTNGDLTIFHTNTVI